MDARERFVELLSASGMSQAEVARRVGENTQWVNNRVRGESDIKADDIPRLAMALRISPSAFFQQSSLAEVVLATFLRVLTEMPRAYRRELWDLVTRMEGRGTVERGDRAEGVSEEDSGRLIQAWEELPEGEREFLLEMIEVRRRVREKGTG